MREFSQWQRMNTLDLLTQWRNSFSMIQRSKQRLSLQPLLVSDLDAGFYDCSILIL
jgi:hypothetical protein